MSKSMTPERAIEILKCDFRGYNSILDEKTATSMAINALEKQMCEKPDYEGDAYDENGNMIYDTWICPNCGKHYEVDYDDYDFCPACGQAIDRTLDWSDEE